MSSDGQCVLNSHALAPNHNGLPIGQLHGSSCLVAGSVLCKSGHPGKQTSSLPRFIETASCRPIWHEVFYVAQGGLEFLLLLSLPPVY